MSTSSLTSLSDPPSSSENEKAPPVKTLKLKNGKLTFSKSKAPRRPTPPSSREPTPEPTREPSPPHQDVLADNPDIAFLVMFRSRFFDAFPRSVPDLGPQDIEQGVVDAVPGQVIENLLCALLGLVLNRKKNVERSHHGRALEEAIATQRAQWPAAWKGANPFLGGVTFESMDPTQRLTLLKTLAMWSLSTSEVIGNIIKEAYKQTRQNEDKNQPLAVQPWGTDSLKRRYWLIEGHTDAPFRLYRETSAKMSRDAKTAQDTWWSMAGTIDELKAFGDKLREEKSQAARRLADGITASIPRLELAEDKRRKREYRASRKAAFATKPDYSMYEGRTRGRRQRYNFSEEDSEAEDTDRGALRSSNRISDRSTPADNANTTVTASGRQVKSRFGRSYGDPMQASDASSREDTANVLDDGDEDELLGSGGGRPRRSTRDQRNGRSAKSRSRLGNTYKSLSSSEEEDDALSTGDEWAGDDDDIIGKYDEEEEEDDAMSDSDSIDSLMHHDVTPKELVVKLKVRRPDTSQLESKVPPFTGSSIPPLTQSERQSSDTIQVKPASGFGITMSTTSAASSVLDAPHNHFKSQDGPTHAGDIVMQDTNHLAHLSLNGFNPDLETHANLNETKPVPMDHDQDGQLARSAVAAEGSSM